MCPIGKALGSQRFSGWRALGYARRAIAGNDKFCGGSAVLAPLGYGKHHFTSANFISTGESVTEQPPPPPPGYPPQQPVGQAPNNYLVWSILATLFCFPITGIVAIVKAA